MVKLDKYMKDTYTAKIIRVDEGSGRDFVAEQAWKDWQGDLDRAYINVVAEIGNSELTQLLMLPKESGYFKSNLKNFIDKNDLPNDTVEWVGREVQVAPNKQGFLRMVL